jgi:hypothetical protein
VGLGLGRARNITLGRAAVIDGLIGRILRACVLMTCMTGLSACSSVGSITGAVAGIASGSAVANPAVGLAVGIGVQAGVDASIKAAMRHMSHEEQAQLAALAGSMQVGEYQAWSVEHAISYGNSEGRVTVVREFSTPLSTCKEAVFSVHDANPKLGHRPGFVTVVCHGAEGWQWALAEPAVARWGVLQ